MFQVPKRRTLKRVNCFQKEDNIISFMDSRNKQRGDLKCHLVWPQSKKGLKTMIAAHHKNMGDSVDASISGQI